MAETFKNSNVRELDLSYLDLSNVYRINGLFETSNIKKLKFCNNSTSNLKRCHSTFSGCVMTELDISIDIAEDASMDEMFAWSQIDRLNLNFKNPLNIGTVIITMLGVAFLISDIVIIIAMLFLALACAIWIQKQIIKVIIWFLKK